MLPALLDVRAAVLVLGALHHFCPQGYKQPDRDRGLWGIGLSDCSFPPITSAGWQRGSFSNPPPGAPLSDCRIIDHEILCSVYRLDISRSEQIFGSWESRGEAILCQDGSEKSRVETPRQMRQI
ncbi:unnamed protein product [Pleuronectes platessa]|uniref:Uncharacterized protein n=1 Tax=Pleuronectes platessa TaxID=8262 RepID=A0A9N7UBH0_PLEPL|nr:unnamed protein product [Pleuronectes platessa]